MIGRSASLLAWGAACRQEQASPLTVPLLRRMGTVVSTEVDFDTVLALVCALFTLACVGTFLNLKPGDIRDVAGGKVRVLLSQLKGERRGRFWTPYLNGWHRVRVSSGPYGLTRASFLCARLRHFAF